MSYQFYKVLHLTGIFMIVLSLGGAFLHSLNGGLKTNNKFKKGLAITHGVGLAIAFVAGFGLLARLGLTTGLPGWTYAKIAIWLVLGGILMVPYRKPELAKPLWFCTILLCVLAAWLAGYKPF